MGPVLTLDIPDEIYVPLLQQAQQVGKTPEETVLAWVIQRVSDDPLLQLAGSFASTMPDVSDRHDAYIGQSFMEEFRRNDHG